MINIAFSFDDGRKDNFINAKYLLEKYNLSATFNITTGYVLGTNEIHENPCSNVAMNIEELIKLSSNSKFEIAGHGYKHNNNLENLITGVKELRNILNVNINGIASPSSQFSIDNKERFQKICQKNAIKYLRISKNFKNKVFIRKVIRKVNSIIKSKKLFYYTYKDSDYKNDFIIYSVPVLKNNTIEQMKYFIKKAIVENKSYVFMFHSILKSDDKFYGDLYTWDYDDFEKLSSYLSKLENENVIKVVRVNEL